jgi:hypothetical protein
MKCCKYNPWIISSIIPYFVLSASNHCSPLWANLFHWINNKIEQAHTRLCTFFTTLEVDTWSREHFENVNNCRNVKNTFYVDNMVIRCLIHMSFIILNIIEAQDGHFLAQILSSITVEISVLTLNFYKEKMILFFWVEIAMLWIFYGDKCCVCMKE